MTSRGVRPAGFVRAAGGVLWRNRGNGAVEVALVHRPKYGDWSLPKGKLRQGEHPLVTACREVAEETGVHAVAGRRLDVSHYDSGAGAQGRGVLGDARPAGAVRAHGGGGPAGLAAAG